ncbi:MAG TPA: hypothetical protein VIH57_03590 [Bacteroidales bacterium]
MVAFVLVLSSCEKEPSKVYYVNLEKPGDAPVLDFGFNLKSDTVAYYQGNFLELKVNQGKYRIISAKCIIDGTEWNFSNRNDTLIRDLYNLSDGTHKLKIEITTNSGTNSIADNLEMEGYVYTTRELTLVKKNLYSVYHGTAKVLNKGASLTWKEFDGLNIQKYRIVKLSNGQSFESSNNSFIDNDYSGEDGIYNIYVVESGNNAYAWAQCTISGNLPTLKTGFVNNKLALTWKSTQYVDKMKEYQLFYAKYWGSWQYLATLSVQDTSFMLNNFTYGDQANFYLYSVPKANVVSDYKYLFYATFSGSLSVPCPSFDIVRGMSCNAFYYSKWDNNIYKFSFLTNKVDTIVKNDNTWGISPSSKYLIRCPDDELKELELYELNPLRKIKSIKMTTIDNTYNWTVSPLQISDNGICGLYYRNMSYKDKLCIYDILNEKIIDSKMLSKSYDIKIASDGTYISLAADSVLIYHINQNSMSLSCGYKLSGTYIYYANYGFIFNKPGQFYIYESPNLKIKSCTDFSTLRTIPLLGIFNSIDFCSNKVLTTSSTYYYIYDFSTGSLIETIPEIWGQVNPGGIWLSNNIIFYPGYQYHISQ